MLIGMQKVNVSVRLDQPLIERVDAVARRSGSTRGECLRQFIEAQLWAAEQELWEQHYERTMVADSEADERLHYNADQVAPELTDEDW